MKLGKGVSDAVTGFDDPALKELQEQARLAHVARRKSFVARLPLTDPVDRLSDVPSWSAAIQQIEQHQWKLSQWSVCPEATGPVAYAVFASA